ncbi:MAG: response regulator [Phycisphaerales bacterium]|nr:response regulator [Phycisphaerales bacterium]
MNHRILVVEDNPDNMKLVTWLLEDEGWAFECAPTAEEGLAQVQAKTFDVVLMDISLPGMNGDEATRLLRQDPKHETLPIIALTAHAVAGEREKILASGVTALVTKPIDEHMLVTMIKQALNGCGG